MSLRDSLRDRRQRWLLERARTGSEPAFRRLYRELYEPVTGFVVRRIESRDDAEDVTSQIFLRFLRKLDHFDPTRGSVWTWVMTLSRHAVIDFHRGRRTHESLELVEDSLREAEPDPLEMLVEAEEARLVHGILADESAEVREIFVLRYTDGLKYREIAEILQLSEASVKQRFSRTMRRIRQQRSQLETRGDEHEAMGIRSA